MFLITVSYVLILTDIVHGVRERLLSTLGGLLLLGYHLLLLLVLLARYVTATHVQMGAPVLTLTGGNSIARVVYVLVVDVASSRNLRSRVGRNPNDFLVKVVEIWFFRFHETLRFVKIVLGTHAALGLGAVLPMQLVTAPFVRRSTSCRTATVRPLPLISMTEIVKVVKH